MVQRETEPYLRNTAGTNVFPAAQSRPTFLRNLSHFNSETEHPQHKTAAVRILAASVNSHNSVVAVIMLGWYCINEKRWENDVMVSHHSTYETAEIFWNCVWPDLQSQHPLQLASVYKPTPSHLSSSLDRSPQDVPSLVFLKACIHLAFLPHIVTYLKRNEIKIVFLFWHFTYVMNMKQGIKQ